MVSLRREAAMRNMQLGFFKLLQELLSTSCVCLKTCRLLIYAEILLNLFFSSCLVDSSSAVTSSSNKDKDQKQGRIVVEAKR